MPDCPAFYITKLRRKNMTKRRSFNAFLVLIVGLMFVFGDAFFVCAQETKSEEFTLEEITVTAQKRAENQQKVAISMEVISSADIKELGKTNLDEILTNVSSAIVQKAADGYRISLRGISDDSSASFGQSMATPTVAINTDGVYSNRKDTGSSLYDVERVEVLYGPQSTMYSSASPGGIVNVVTASPKLDRYEVSGSIESGSYSLLNLQGALNVPVAEQVALRASVQSSKRDGYLTGGGDNENSKSARLRALY
jgi:iron complex outermembrane recepter protein